MVGASPLTTMTGTFSALAAPGTYDLYYRQYHEGPAVPINTSTKVQSGIVVGTSPLSLDLDVPATTGSATVTINGSAASARSYELSYGVYRTDPAMPGNTRAGLGCFTVPAPHAVVSRGARSAASRRRRAILLTKFPSPSQ